MNETEISAGLPQIKIQTDRGNMIVEMFEDDAPNTVANMIFLIENGKCRSRHQRQPVFYHTWPHPSFGR